MIRYLGFALCALGTLFAVAFAQPVRQFVPGSGSKECPLSPATDAWSPTWFFDTWFTVSGGGLTVNLASAGLSNPAPEIDLIGHKTGVYYHELTVTAASPGDMAWGYAAQAFLKPNKTRHGQRSSAQHRLL